jgi:tRNA(Arg) A34 adenosine deaminase TadA
MLLIIPFLLDRQRCPIGKDAQYGKDARAKTGSAFMQGNNEFMQQANQFMRQAIALATENVTSGRGGPFGAVVVKDGKVIATGVNLVTASNDPTAHAEVTAIRSACQSLAAFQLEGCDVYTSCEPCPMCLAAIYWSRCKAIYYGNTAADADQVGFDDAVLYDEVKKPLGERRIPIVQMLPDEAWVSFAAWRDAAVKVVY